MLALMSLISMGCQEKSKKSSSSSQQSAYCMQNPYAQGCYGATTAGTTGGTTNQTCFQSTNNYWSMPGCPGFCQNYPTHPNCAGTTSGGTTSGSTTGSTTGGGSNPYPQYPSNGINQNWGVQYPPNNIPPQGNCAAAVSPSGINYTPYETRKATMALAGKTFYSPASANAGNLTNTSSILKSVNTARTLFETDSVLKVRLKPRPQPENTSSSPYCYIPSYQKMSSVAGYTKLEFNVVLVGRRANGTEDQEPLGTFMVGVNSCTPAIDLSSYTSTYPDGIYLIVQSVRSNQGVYPNDYPQNGFTNSNTFTDVRSMDCWVLDVEVAADGTKTFN